MDKRIYKYNLDITDYQQLQLPYESKILSIQNQDNKLTLWALIDTKHLDNLEERSFEVFGTGHPIYYDMGIDREYLATVQINNFVWHIFEYTGI